MVETAQASCEYCGVQFLRAVNATRLQRFCSKTCGYASRRKPTSELRARRMVNAPGHPLAFKGRYIPAARLILWEKIGPGEHPCHYCGTIVAWLPGAATAAGALVADHKDRDGMNDDPDNLVPACQTCNIFNSERVVRDDEVFLTRGHTRLRGVQRRCEDCGEEFVTYPDPRPNRGRFCSRSCARRHQHRLEERLA